MLGTRGIIPAAAAAALDAALAAIAAELEAGTLAVDPEVEDVHSFIEGVLTERLGDLGRMVHAGRSRNDQVALDVRLYLKRVVPELAAEVRALIAVLLDRAAEHAESVMPGYTHLQRAQPVTLGHHLVAWCAGLERDAGRLSDALRLSRGRLFPLGWYRLLKALKKPEVIDMYLVAVRPEYQSRGVIAVLMTDLNRSAIEAGVKYAETNPELETNLAVQQLWKDYDKRQHRRRRVYLKSL